MTHILDRIGSTRDTPLAWAWLDHHLSLLVRAHRLARIRRARLRLLHGVVRDPRWYADIGLDVKKHGRHDWLGDMVRAMGAR